VHPVFKRKGGRREEGGGRREEGGGNRDSPPSLLGRRE